MSEPRKMDRKTLILLFFAVLALFLLPRPPSSSTTATTAPMQASPPTFDTTTPGYQAALKSFNEAVQAANGVEKQNGPGGTYYSWPPQRKSTACETVYSGNREKDRASWTTSCR